MARKISLLIALLCVCLSLTSTAFAYTSYDSGNISTTYVQYFRDTVNSLPTDFNYVAFRSGQYEYVLHASDSLKYSNGQYLSDTGVTYKWTQGSGYNSTYTYDVSHEQNFVLNCNNQMVYSDIGDYPSLTERGSTYAFGILCAAVIGGICVLIRPMFKYVLRIR